MLSFLWYLGIYALVIMRACVAFSAALLDGIACARDEQHRMTPLDPWVLFRTGWCRRGRPFLTYMGAGDVYYITNSILLSYPQAEHS